MARVWISPKPWSWTRPSKASNAAAVGDHGPTAPQATRAAATARASFRRAFSRLTRVMHPPRPVAGSLGPAPPPGDPALVTRAQHRRDAGLATAVRRALCWRLTPRFPTALGSSAAVF